MPQEVTRYALYGEDSAPISPEFLHVERIVDRSSQHDWTIAPHAHPGLWQVLLVEQGGALLASERGQHRVAGPGLFLVPAGAVHAFRFTPQAQGWVLSFAAALLHDPRIAGFVGALDLAGGGAQWFALDGDDAMATRLERAIADLDMGQGGGAGFGPVTLAGLAMVLACADGLRRRSRKAPRLHPRVALAQRFRALVEGHYRQHWSVADYAAALGTTPATLTRACGEAFGSAPAALVHERLLLEAQRHLAFTAAPVASIADRLGYADPAYFARFFKAGTGLTASAWRAREGWRGR
jgi:AraC family transcriptional regulator, transcriptional activator of pobA